jgi:hypothetical protein
MKRKVERAGDAPVAAPSRFAWEVIKHPVTGIGIALAMSIAFHQLSQREPAPSFATSFTETIASAESTDPRLVITWDGHRIPGVSSTRLVLWNAGRDYVDPADFLRPITIVPAEPVQLLDVGVVRTSRPELRFIPTVHVDSVLKRQVIRLAAQGDEVLERDDGAVVRILYASTRRDSLSGVGFQVTGRIKGVPGGFRRLNWNEGNAGAPVLSTIIVILLWAAFIVGGLWKIARDWHKDSRRERAKGLIVVAGITLWFVLTVREATAPWPEWAPTAGSETDRSSR